MRIKLTESTLNKIVSEAVRKVLQEAYDYEQTEYINSEKKQLEELALYLKRNGIESVHVGSYPSGLPCLKINTDEYRTKHVFSLGDKFAETKGKILKYDSYPATTYLHLETY